jgi:dethiobiotin synthetase
MTATFVTATGTDIGKTFVTAALVEYLRRTGRPVAALKPVVSGFDEQSVEASDPTVLLRALGRPVTLEEIARIAPFRFRAPLAPDLAAAREGRTLDVDEVIAFTRAAITAHNGHLFIEGVGGIMVPLDERRTVLDWMEALKLPLLMITGGYLGTISHTLTALDVLARRGLSVRAIVVSQSEHDTVPLDDTIATIARFADAPVLGLPRLSPGVREHPMFETLAALL